MKNAFFSFLITAALLTSCQKDDNPTPPPAVHYMNLTAGSTWNYELINNLPTSSTSTFTLTSTAGDSTINGKSYHVFTNSSGTGNEYQNITGSDYYNFQNLPAALGGSGVEYLYLKDNVAAGTSWSQTYPVTASGISFNATLTNTLTEKGLSKTVKGVAYMEVMHVTTTLSISLAGIPLPAGALTTDIQSFYAPNVGLIQSVNKIDVDFSGITEHTDQQTSLVSSNLK